METLYTPTPQEKILIDNLLSIFYYYKFEKAELPKIFTSNDNIPPERVNQLIEVGILNKLDEVDKKVNGDFKNIDLNKYCIDTLGLYCPKEVKIILFTNRIIATAEELKFNKDLLQEIVLLHEIGHWISHKLIYNKTHWASYSHSKETIEIHEGLAQLYTWWVVNKLPKLKKTFNTLNELQSPTYLVWKYFKNSAPECLILLREFETFSKEDWLKYDFWLIEQPNKSIEDIINDHRGKLLSIKTGIL